MKLNHELCMQYAELIAKQSKGIRAKVGALLVTTNGVQIPGYNGTAPGRPNELEEDVLLEDGTIRLVTKPEVIHAELNCIIKAAREGVATLGSTVFVTHAPCVHCAALLVSCGVAHVYFRSHYKTDDGIDLLRSCNVNVKPMYRNGA